MFVIEIKKIDLKECNKLNLEKIEKFKPPFFLYIHLMDAHHHFDDFLKEDECNDFSINKTSLNLKLSLIRKKKDLNIFHEEELKCIIERYKKGIESAMFKIFKIFQILSLNNFYSNSIIIITSDHGEGFGEHGFYFHGNPVYNEFIHIPLFIKFPNYSNGTINQAVRLVDIFPTILDFLQIKIDNNLEGISLLPIVRGRNLNLSIYSEIEGRALIINNYKLLILPKNNTIEFYNIKDDPKELNNLVKEKPKLVSEYMNMMEKFALTLKKRKTFSPIIVEMSEEIKEKLRRLGYIT